MFKSWRYIPHTADMQFVSKGKTLEEAFKNAAYATFNYLVDPKKVKKAVKKEIKIKAKRDISLLYDYLEEMLYLLDTEGFLLAEVEKIKITEKEGELTLKATIHGD
ncbi:MAG: archease, partial [Candidatus Nanoarchaeia archaeon]